MKEAMGKEVDGKGTKWNWQGRRLEEEREGRREGEEMRVRRKGGGTYLIIYNHLLERR